MIKIAFSDMKTGVTVMIEVAEPSELKESWVALGAIGIQPVGCHSCKSEHGGEIISGGINDVLPSLGDSENGPGPGQLPENWNPDDFPNPYPQTG